MADKHFVLFYSYVPDIMEKRAPFRAGHLGLAREAVARGELVLGGAFTDVAAGGMIVFKGESDAVVKKFVDADPYVKAGLVTSWKIREWTTVVGEGALTQVKL
jgi:uncharacterized protein YciI